MNRLVLWLNAPMAWAVFLSVSLVNMVLAVVLQLVALPLDRQRRVALWTNHVIWGHGLFALEPFWRAERQGLSQIGCGPYVIVCNHNSVLDVPMCLGLPVPTRVVAKRSLLKVPFMGWYMRFSGMIPLDRGGTPEQTASSLKALKESLDDGVSILIFPEGTRSDDGDMGGFNRGAFRLSKDLNVPVLPVVIDGTGAFLGKGHLLPQAVRGLFRLHVLEPVDPAPYSTARKMSNRVHERMSTALSALRA